MSKKIKQLICDELSQRLADVEACLVIDPTKLDGTTANNLRGELARADVTLLHVKNSLARRALADLPLAPVASLLEGPCSLAFGGESIVDVAKMLVEKTKQLPLEIKGAVMEGNALDAKGAVNLSKLPSKGELRAQIVSQVLSPGSKLAGALVAFGGIAQIIKGRIEQLEKQEGGETEAA